MIFQIGSIFVENLLFFLLFIHQLMNESTFLNLKQYRSVEVMAAAILSPSIGMLLHISMRDATASSNDTFCRQAL